MANRRKRKTRWQWPHSIMWWAFVVSGLLHVGLVYWLPTVDFLPADPGYIEIDDTWLATFPDDDAVSDASAEAIDDGGETVAQADRATDWHIPTHTRALEPLPATERRTDNAWDMAFIGLDPDRSETLAQPEYARARLTAPADTDIPPLTLQDLAARIADKERPQPDGRKAPADEPEIRAGADDVELQAEQRFQDALFADITESRPDMLAPERRSPALPETVATEPERAPLAATLTRQTAVRPERLPSVLSVLPSVAPDKSRPPVVVPEIPERPLLDAEEVMAAAAPVIHLPEISAPAARPDPSDALAEPATLAASPAFSPEPRRPEPRIEATPDVRQAPEIVSPAARDMFPLTAAMVPAKTGVAPHAAARRPELPLNDGEIRVSQPVLRQPTPQAAAAATPRADARPPIRSQALIPTEPRDPLSGVRPQLARSPAERSLILGAADHVPILPVEGPRFGIIVRKERALPEQEMLPEPALRPDDIVEHAADDPAPGADEFVIEGPAAARQVLFKPRQFPEVELERDVTIRLQFWVLPDGTVGEVLPLQRGDLRLERAAIAYLKSWRFTPVSPDQPQVWGIIPITYTLR